MFEPEVLELVLEGNAGKIVYAHPAQQEQFISKAWRVRMELDWDWAKKAMQLNFQEVCQAFKKNRYGQSQYYGLPGNYLFWKHKMPIFVFSEKDSGLVRAIVQLSRDCDWKPEYIVP